MERENETNETFTWLHLTDLHAGMSNQGWLWPTLKTAFHDDLRDQLAKVGSLDAIFFTGDLTQRGEKKEFEQVTIILNEILEICLSVGLKPMVIPIPGNHDLSRPKPDDPLPMLLSMWNEKQEVRENFWPENSPYLKLVDGCFVNYSNWLESVIANEVVSRPVVKGIIPGDCSFVIQANDRKIGIIGLNSAWLQLNAEDFERKIHVDPRQLNSLTDADPDKWCRKNDANIILTHHPASWLSPENFDQWNSEINPPGRFDAHLFGHMHQPDAATVSQGGASPRTALQGASIFGLENLGNGKHKRIHGYSIGQISFSNDKNIRSIRPRILRTQIGGKRKIVPDYDFDLNDNHEFIEEYSSLSREKNRTIAVSSPRPPVHLSPKAMDDDAILGKVRHVLISSKPSAHIRVAEQETFKSLAEDRKPIWLIAEWGMGSDGFLWSTQIRLKQEGSPAYRIDLQNFKGREKFFDEIQEKLGCSFAQLCELLSNRGKSYIIFDDVPIGNPASDSIKVEGEVEDLAGIVGEYCPESTIVIRSRHNPDNNKISKIQLGPLDEPDTAVYISNSDYGSDALSRQNSVEKIYRHTEGLPSRIDLALKELQVVGISDLVRNNPDLIAGTQLATQNDPTLLKVVNELAISDEDFFKRSYDLLKTLCAFPQGEQLERVKRFNHANPYHTAHAHELLRRSLINAAPLASIGAKSSEELAKVLIVPKALRDYMRSGLTQEELESLDRKALELYFGSNWKTGEISSPSGHRFDNALQSGYKISNAHALITRLYRQALEDNDNDDILTALRVTSAYLAALIKGDHFRSVVSFCDDLFHDSPIEEYEAQFSIIKLQYARSLRMIGESEKARDILSILDISILPKMLRQLAYINLALCYQSLGETDLAKTFASKTITLGKNEAHALQAKSIIIELDDGDPNRWEKLRELEDLARKKKAFTTANNIALTMAGRDGISANESEMIIDKVFRDARGNRDFYNEARSIIRLSKIKLSRGESLTFVEKTRLIDTYHFLFNERLPGLFDRCHESLWLEFERHNDADNMLRLFRHSSLIWRLRGADHKEADYLRKIASKLVATGVSARRSIDKENAYYLSRANSALLAAPAPAEDSIIRS